MTRFSLIDTTLERRLAELADAEPLQRVTDALLRKGPWSGNNQLGYSLPFKPDANNRQTVLKLDEWGFPEVWTLSLNIKGFPGGSFDGFGVKGIVEFGAGGSTHVLAVDWVNGTQLSLPMNALNVIAEFSDLDVSEIGQGLELSVQLARGARAGNARAPVLTLTETETIAAGGNTELLPIPKFAKRIVARPTGFVAGELAAFFSATTVLSLNSGTSGGHSVQSIRGTELATLGGVDVTGEARFVRLVNGSATAFAATVYAEIAA